jgi:Ankyrin repeats (3 copies)
MTEVIIPKQILSIKDLTSNQQFLLAAYRGNTPLIHGFLDNNFDEDFDPNCYDDNGFTAIHAASARGFKEIVLALVNSDRINVNILDKMARHPIEIAWKSGYKEIVSILYESLPAKGMELSGVKEKEEFVRMLFGSKDDIMGKTIDLSRLKEMSVKPVFSADLARSTKFE